MCENFMKNQKKKAFTLAELLVVVLIVGVLSTVAVPKMKSVIETRRTTEAEDIMTAVRTEQEKRCVLGKQYLMDSSKVDALANASNSTNYSYALDSTGIVAQSKGKDYNLQIRSYKTGEICCQGEYCASLNKNYPSCDSIAVLTDECAGVAPNEPPQEPEIPTPEPEDDCITNPNQEKCCDEGEEWNGSECVTPTTPEPEDDCITNPNQEKCCDEGEEWDGEKCVKPCKDCSCQEYAEKNRCECDATYAEANPCQCSADYASENALECKCKSNPTEECYEYSWVVTKKEKLSQAGYCDYTTSPGTCNMPRYCTESVRISYISGVELYQNVCTGSGRRQTCRMSKVTTGDNECKASTLGKTAVYQRDCGYSEEVSATRHNIYHARITETCQKNLKDFSSSGSSSGGGRVPSRS